MGKLEVALVEYGKKRRLGKTPGEVLKALFLSLGKSKAEIARLLGCTGAGVASALLRYGIESKSRVSSLLDAMLRAGYESEEECFLKNARMTFRGLAEHLGVHPDTVSRRFRRFQIQRAKAARDKRMLALLRTKKR